MSIGLCNPAATRLQVKAAGSGNPVGAAGEAGRSVGGGGAVGSGNATVACGNWLATLGAISPAGSVDGISEQANNRGTEAIRTRRTGQTPRVIRIVSLRGAPPGRPLRGPFREAKHHAKTRRSAIPSGMLSAMRRRDPRGMMNL